MMSSWSSSIPPSMPPSTSAPLCASSLQLQLLSGWLFGVAVVVVAADAVQPDAIEVRAIDELRIELQSSSSRQAADVCGWGI